MHINRIILSCAVLTSFLSYPMKFDWSDLYQSEELKKSVLVKSVAVGLSFFITDSLSIYLECKNRPLALKTGVVSAFFWTSSIAAVSLYYSPEYKAIVTQKKLERLQKNPRLIESLFHRHNPEKILAEDLENHCNDCDHLARTRQTLASLINSTWSGLLHQPKKSAARLEAIETSKLVDRSRFFYIRCNNLIYHLQSLDAHLERSQRAIENREL
jgi:hypothetical protein